MHDRKPIFKDYLRIVDKNQFLNCPVTKRYMMSAKDIFGPDIGCLKIKTVRKSSQQVPHSHMRMALPPDVHEQYRLVTMSIDIIFFNKIAFFVSIYQGLKFRSAE